MDRPARSSRRARPAKYCAIGSAVRNVSLGVGVRISMRDSSRAVNAASDPTDHPPTLPDNFVAPMIVVCVGTSESADGGKSVGARPMRLL